MRHAYKRGASSQEEAQRPPNAHREGQESPRYSWTERVSAEENHAKHWELGTGADHGVGRRGRTRSVAWIPDKRIFEDGDFEGWDDKAGSTRGGKRAAAKPVGAVTRKTKSTKDEVAKVRSAEGGPTKDKPAKGKAGKEKPVKGKPTGGKSPKTQAEQKHQGKDLAAPVTSKSTESGKATSYPVKSSKDSSKTGTPRSLRSDPVEVASLTEGPAAVADGVGAVSSPVLPLADDPVGVGGSSSVVSLILPLDDDPVGVGDVGTVSSPALSSVDDSAGAGAGAAVSSPVLPLDDDPVGVGDSLPVASLILPLDDDPVGIGDVGLSSSPVLPSVDDSAGPAAADGVGSASSPVPSLRDDSVPAGGSSSVASLILPLDDDPVGVGDVGLSSSPVSSLPTSLTADSAGDGDVVSASKPISLQAGNPVEVKDDVPKSVQAVSAQPEQAVHSVEGTGTGTPSPKVASPKVTFPAAASSMAVGVAPKQGWSWQKPVLTTEPRSESRTEAKPESRSESVPNAKQASAANAGWSFASTPAAAEVSRPSSEPEPTAPSATVRAVEQSPSFTPRPSAARKRQSVGSESPSGSGRVVKSKPARKSESPKNAVEAGKIDGGLGKKAASSDKANDKPAQKKPASVSGSPKKDLNPGDAGSTGGTHTTWSSVIGGAGKTAGFSKAIRHAKRTTVPQKARTVRGVADTAKKTVAATKPKVGTDKPVDSVKIGKSAGSKERIKPSEARKVDKPTSTPRSGKPAGSRGPSKQTVSRNPDKKVVAGKQVGSRKPTTPTGKAVAVKEHKAKIRVNVNQAMDAAVGQSAFAFVYLAINIMVVVLGSSVVITYLRGRISSETQNFLLRGGLYLLSCLVAVVYAFSSERQTMTGHELHGDDDVRWNIGRRIVAWPLVLALALLVVGQGIVLGLNRGLEALVPMIHVTPAVLMSPLNDLYGSAPMMLYALLILPLTEEIIFRGVIMNGLRRFGRVFAIITSAFLCAFMQMQPVQAIWAFLIGLVLGALSMEYGLVWAIGAHILASVGYSGLIPRWLSNAPVQVRWAVAVVLALIVVAGLVILVRKFSSLRAYAREYRAPKGVYASWRQSWFVIFCLCSLAVAVFQYM
ncbi:type II CAAX prenyl endopeptidase Rce1 family protein [Bifidobacterium coryneforme]|uniref:CPBP family glutamic-type intramembrane protease n=2 Tax=Bifidobacterium coryneforme TaxID=1687 RepID=UPI0004E5D7E8|nr:CPBP family glutamic-type intramembrane protease [Bifidobacterium coryneforme]AII74276.1 CAAX amino terminal protease [Bifidobacterium coryneforme]